MSISSFSVRRPVTVLMVVSGIIMLGIISWNRLPQELFPPITYPQITVVTNYENAAPEEIEALVTRPIEETIGTVTNIRRINSTSREGMSLVMCDFNWGTNMDFAALNVREKIDLIKDKLPRDAKEPIVMKYNPFELPIVVLSVSGRGMSPYDLKEVCRRQIKDALEKVEGVAQATLIGGREREILVELNQGRLRAFGISILSIIDTLKATNLNYPAGSIETSFYEYLVRTIGEFKAVSEMQDVPMMLEEKKEEEEKQQVPAEERKKEKLRRLIYMRDVAKIKDTLKEQTSISRYNGEENITISLQKQAGANTLHTARRIYQAIDDMQVSLPKGVEIKVVSDQSVYIKNSINELRDNSWQGGLLALIILLLFLRNLRGSMVVTFNIPISVLFTLIVMYFMGVTLNMMSLGGLALGVGMLVDNGIVTIENIYRHRQMGKTSLQAAQDGSEEITGALVSSTLTTVAVFFPLAFVTGIAGQLFKELAITVSFSLIASLFLAISLIPVFMTGGKISLKHVSEDKFIKTAVLPPKKQAMNYLAIFLILGIVIALFLGSVKVFLSLNREFLPKMDQRQFILKVNMPGGTRLEVTDRVARRVENIVLSIPDIRDVTVNIGSDKEAALAGSVELLESYQAQIFVNLKPLPAAQLFKLGKAKGTPENPQRHTAVVVQELRERIARENLEQAEIGYILQESVFKSAMTGNADVVIETKGFEMDKLKAIVQETERRLKNIKGMVDIKDTLSPPSPETKITVNKDRAALYQLSVNQIANVANAAIKGVVASKFKEKGREVDIRVKLREEDRKDFATVGRLLLVTPLGINIFLDQVANLKQDLGPSEIKRIDKQRVIIVTANIYQRVLSEVVDEVNAQLKDIRSHIPVNYSIELAGENKELTDSFKSLQFAMILALALVYMIMAAQFESLMQPFIIMFTIPLSLIGVSAALMITKTPVSAVVIMGVIMLGGIVVNNGILLIDFINIARGQGMGIFEAAVQSSKVRMRPVLMTALTTIVGLIPLAMGLGEGGELRAPLAITVMGGLTSATFLTLVVVPCIYILMEKMRESIFGAFKPVSPLPKKEPVVMPAAEPPLAVSPAAEVILPPEPLPARELNERQRHALEYIKSSGKITRVEYIIKFQINLAVADEDLASLVRLGLIREIGEGTHKYYEAV